MSVYVVTRLWVRAKSWGDAAKQAIERAVKTVEGLCIGEMLKQDATIENGKVANYLVRLRLRVLTSCRLGVARISRA